MSTAPVIVSGRAVDPARALVVGVDFGTLSGRVLVARAADGEELGSAVTAYRHGVLDRNLPSTGAPLPPAWALQVPSDYVHVLCEAVPAALAAACVDPRDVVGIATDFTSATMVPTTGDGTPLCELPAYAGEPHAYPKLWKHHAAQRHADRINSVAQQRGEPWLARYGGRTSAEWQYPKALQLLEEAPEVYRATTHWIEAADWIVWQLCGRPVRSAAAAGYKGFRQDGCGPGPDFCLALHPGLADLPAKLGGPTGRLGQRAGGLTERAAAWTGLPAGTTVAVGNIDAHATAVAAGAVVPGRLVATMGTSICLLLNAEDAVEVPGMSGVVDGGIVEGLWGYEAGQSGVGDIFGWFVDTSLPAAYADEARRRGVSAHELLTELAAEHPPGRHGLIALDWHSGNRSVLADHGLSGMVLGSTLTTRPEDTYRALLEATAFGTRTIVEAFGGAGLAVEEFVGAGGLTSNGFLMQLYADVLRIPIGTARSGQCAALGAAIHAAVAAGAHPDVATAAEAMSGRDLARYRPDPVAACVYDALFDEYRALHDHFGRGGNDVMHRLRAIQRSSAEGVR